MQNNTQIKTPSSSDVKREKKRRRRIPPAIVALIVIFVLVAMVVAAYFILRIRTVEFSGSEVYSHEQLMSASGIVFGEKMYGINKGSIEDNIIKGCPYVKQAVITRGLPSTLKIAIEEYLPVFYIEVSGEYFVFGENMRVLERLTSKEDAESRGLIKLAISGASHAIVGQYLVINDGKDDNFIKKVMRGVMDSQIYERINIVDIRNKYDIFVVCDGLYKMLLGDSSDITVKLNLGGKILEDSMFDNNQNKAQIDLTNTTEPSVIVDNQIVFE